MEMQNVITRRGGDGMSVPVEVTTKEGKCSIEHFKVSLFVLPARLAGTGLTSFIPLSPLSFAGWDRICLEVSWVNKRYIGKHSHRIKYQFSATHHIYVATEDVVFFRVLSWEDPFIF